MRSQLQKAEAEAFMSLESHFQKIKQKVENQKDEIMKQIGFLTASN